MKRNTLLCLLFGLVIILGLNSSVQTADNVTLVVASVNNPDMQIMEELSKVFTEETGIKVQFTILPENDIRSKITQDVAIGGGKFDLVTLGTSDIATYVDNGWTVPLEPFFEKMTPEEKEWYDKDDLFSSVLPAYSSTTKGLAAIPFYAEGTMLFYRKDLFAEKNLTISKEPTWQEVYKLAKKLHDPAKGIYGIAIRGLPGYGQNMYIFNTIINAFGARWFDMEWNPQFKTPEMREAFEFYKKIITEVAEPSPTTFGYTECLNLMSSGRAAMWYDATVAGGTMEGLPNSAVKGKIGYALSPTAKKKNTSAVGGWGLSITSSSKHKDEAFKFLTWATSKDYVKLVGETKGWALVPSGTRESTYQLSQYQESAPFAEMTYLTLKNASWVKPTIDPVPYTGNSLLNMPEYSSFGEKIAQEVAAYIAGQKDLDSVLDKCQSIALQAVIEGGYRK